jgi:hypothetical protein
MTNRKDLKARVRSRAARTGESYTTARRQVLATPGLVPGYPAAGGGTHHESTLLAHLLTQAGQAYTETTLCGLAGGIGFLYAVFQYRDLPPILTVVAQHHPEPWVPAALDRLGVGYRVAHSSSPRAAAAALLADLDAGRAVHCLVDRGGLPWHGGAGPASDAYPVVVAGRDGDDLLIDDGAPRPRRLAADRFTAAWSAYRKGRHQRITVDPPVGLPDLAAAMRAAVATTVAHLTGPVLGNSFDVNFGFSGMRRLADQLRDDRGRSGWRRRFGGDLPFAGWRLFECLERQYTAPGGTRPLYAGFLDEAAEVVGDPAYAAAAVHIRRAGEHWSAVAALARDLAGPSGEEMARRAMAALSGRPDGGPAPQPGPDRSSLLPEIADLVDAARAAEESAVTLLARS